MSASSSLPRCVLAACLCLLFSHLAQAATPAAFDEAAKLYDAQEYGAARERYEQLVSDGALSANVFYNLGNAEFRLGHSGRAILAYERALLLDPLHPEAQANLALVRSRAGAKSLPPSWIDPVLLPLSAPAYCLIGAVAAWVCIFAIAITLFWKRTRVLLLGLSALSVLVVAYSGAALLRNHQRRAVAVIIAPEAVARLEAADRSGVAEPLPTGSDVRVLSEHGDWIYCELPGHGRGWLPAHSLERITGVTT